LTCEVLVTSGVTVADRMLSAVDFDDQLRLDTREVGDVWWDRVLAAEAEAVNLPVAQRAPETTFGGGQVSPQFSRPVPQSGIDPRQQSPHPSPPPPPAGEGIVR
jgi:hypothetical protein